MRGRVLRIVAERGYGFVEADGYPRGCFFHIRDLERAVPFDQQLVHRLREFEIEQTQWGPAAKRVRPIED
jgi:cold shock CspA family protein